MTRLRFTSPSQSHSASGMTSHSPQMNRYSVDRFLYGHDGDLEVRTQRTVYCEEECACARVCVHVRACCLVRGRACARVCPMWCSGMSTAAISNREVAGSIPDDCGHTRLSSLPQTLPDSSFVLLGGWLPTVSEFRSTCMWCDMCAGKT